MGRGVSMLMQGLDGKYLLGLAPMDATHHEFVALVNQLNAAKGEAFKGLFTQLQQHTHAHFAQEESWMHSSNFPALTEHRADHQRVLGDMNRFARQVERGLLPMARAYVRELPNWFLLHASTMDSALAAHLKTGGYPL